MKGWRLITENWCLIIADTERFTCNVTQLGTFHFPICLVFLNVKHHSIRKSPLITIADHLRLCNSQMSTKNVLNRWSNLNNLWLKSISRDDKRVELFPWLRAEGNRFAGSRPAFRYEKLNSDVLERLVLWPHKSIYREQQFTSKLLVLSRVGEAKRRARPKPLLWRSASIMLLTTQGEWIIELSFRRVKNQFLKNICEAKADWKEMNEPQSP
jgi:hypothetical protein